MKLPHPIPYQGSKRNLADQIMRFYPDDFDRLIEPFAGSAPHWSKFSLRNFDLKYIKLKA